MSSIQREHLLFRSPGKAQCRTYLICSLVLLGFIILYFDLLLRTVTLWITRPHFNAHGIIILVGSAYMIWTRKDQLKNLPVKPSVWLGTMLTLSGGLLFVVGKISLTETIYELSLIITLMGTVLLVLGGCYFKELFMPLVFLVFIFPIVGTVMGTKIQFLQSTTALIASKTLQLFNVPTLQSGNILTLPHITLDVARSCSGINQIVTLCIAAFFIGYFFLKSLLARAIILIASLLIGLFANGLRVALIGLWTRLDPTKAVHGPGDILLVSFVIIFGLSSLYLLAGVLGKVFVSKDRGRAKSSKFANPVKPQSAQAFLKASGLALAIYLTVFFATGNLHANTTIAQAQLRNLPLTLGSWQGRDVNRKSNVLSEYPADEHLWRVYENGPDEQIEIQIIYFKSQSWNKKVFKIETTSLFQGGRQMGVRQIVGINGRFQAHRIDPQTLAYVGYYIDNEIYGSKLRTKLALVANTIINSANDSAMVIIRGPEHVLTSSGQTAKTSPSFLSIFFKSLTVLI